jgi:outer membrane lipoprotein SlyB
MKSIFAAATLSLAVFAAPSAHAIGCLSGGAAGGVAGHMAGHHAVLGAIAGCAVGHHIAHRRHVEQAHQRQMQRDDSGMRREDSGDRSFRQ